MAIDLMRELDLDLDDAETERMDNPAAGVTSAPGTPGVFNQPPAPAGGWIQSAEYEDAIEDED
jgi:hypothetical protein